MKGRVARILVRSLLGFLCFAVSAGCILYPFLANLVSEHQSRNAVTAVEEAVAGKDGSELEAELRSARDYNVTLSSGKVRLTDPFLEDVAEEGPGTYESLLSFTEDGIMGSVRIPSIGVWLPIYHGTSDEVLAKGSGHLKGSSLPVGGASTHAVLTGHTGLSGAKLFTDLVELREGDLFYVEACGQLLGYEVVGIQAVLPEEMEPRLRVVPGKDLCTLLTCTPYGVNTHRLLVRGERRTELGSEPFVPSAGRRTKSQWMAEYEIAVGISMICFASCLVLIFYVRFRYAVF